MKDQIRYLEVIRAAGETMWVAVLMGRVKLFEGSLKGWVRILGWQYYMAW